MAANYTVPPIIGQLRLNNGRVATFYETERGSYERAVASGATPIGPPPADTTVVDGEQVSSTENILPSADTLTTGESQATSSYGEQNEPQIYSENQVNQSLSSQDDAIQQAPTSGGVGAGTSSNAYNARGNDNTPPASSTTNQQVINQSFANRPITPQPNVLDRYASYTYAISWWILTPDQYNSLSSGDELAPSFGTGNWSLLMQSGGAPIAGRNPAFPLDYYLDDLEIETFLMGKGTGMSTNGMEIKFKVVEPNGLTLLQNLYKATTSVYKNIKAPNYGAAQYCLTIEFYGYDANGNLVAPATGSIDGSNVRAVIKKYYPFIIQNITFRTVANQIEYMVTGTPVPYATNSAQARGTIPFAYQLSGQTVSQLLVGGGAPTTTPTVSGERTATPAPARVSTPTVAPRNTGQTVNDIRASAGVDALGNFTGETASPFSVVAP